MFKKILWGLIGTIFAVCVIGALAGIKVLQFNTLAANQAKQVVPPQPVNSFDVRQDQWFPRVSAVGSVMAVQGTTVSTEAEGVVREIKFDAGALVKEGDILVELDIDVEKAQLRSAEAAAELARLSFDRAKQLHANRTISQAEYDTADANTKQAKAQLENLRAIIAKKTIRAPFAGRLGIRRISVGQFLNKGSPVVSLQSLDPIYVEFSLPQQRIGDIKQGLKVLVATDAYKDKQFEGEITAFNSDVDATTRSVRVQATLRNVDGRLRPGMFVSVEMVLPRAITVLLIPASAVLPAPYGDSIFLIEEGQGTAGAKSLVARQQFVRLGERRGDFVVVTDGLKVGDKVVSTAPFRLRPGLPVVIDNKLAPEFSLDPKVRNT